MFHAPNKFRMRNGFWRTDNADGPNGVFFVPNSLCKVPAPPLRIIASDQLGWEHVSVSLPDRSPTWEEMCFVKGLFWDDDDCVMQLHPPKSDWVNNHSYCLHLWRPVGAEIPRPDSIMVGIKDMGVLA